MSGLLDRALALPHLELLAGVPGVHLVGGAVRDLLLGRTPVDFDFVVEESEAAEVAARLGGEVKPHDRFGTASVELDGGRYDFARARAESYGRPGALPDVLPAGLEEDLRRRDFTVNTFALALGPPEPGRIRSAPRAELDLAGRLLRTLHPASFEDDPTRILRLARYAGRLGFAAEPQTRERAQTALEAGAIDTVSGPRIGAELRLLSRDPAALEGFAALRGLGGEAAIAPGFAFDAELAKRALALLPEDGRRDLLLLAVACRGAADPAALLARLGFRAEDARAVAVAVAAPPDLAERPASEVAARLASPEQAALAGALGAEDEARRWIDELRGVRLAITGEDLLAAGVPEGPEIGAALREVLALRLDGKVGDDRGAQLEAGLRISPR